jgi:hypothetical protein
MSYDYEEKSSGPVAAFMAARNQDQGTRHGKGIFEPYYKIGERCGQKGMGRQTGSSPAFLLTYRGEFRIKTAERVTHPSGVITDDFPSVTPVCQRSPDE